MKKVTLSNAEISALNVELNGFVNPNNPSQSLKGLTEETLSVKVRFWISRVNSKITEIMTSFEESRQELVKKYGTEKDGFMRVEPIIEVKGKKEVNPKHIEFLKEFRALEDMKEDIEVGELTIEDLGDLKTDVNLNILFKLLS